jgi:hypothetical protein
MPASHHIDNKNKLIITSWCSEPTESELADALHNYQREIKSKPEFIDYHELVDFREIQGIKLRADYLRRLGKISVRYDKSDVNNKLAFVVSSTISYGIARMYAIYRGLYSESKEVRVFKNKPEALAWLNYESHDYDPG